MSQSNSKQRRAINFDLSVELLKEHYPNQDYRKAYKDIKKFLKNNGFSHRQWSGYISDKPIGFLELADSIDKAFNQFPWLEKCATRFDVTNIGRTFDLLKLRESKKDIESESIKLPLDKQIKDANDKASSINAAHQSVSKAPNKSKGIDK